MNNDSAVGLIVLGLYILGIIGWVLNIVQLVSGHSQSGMFALRIVGVIIAPLGSVLGWL